MDQDTLTRELRVWKDRLDRREITETVYERAIERLLDQAGLTAPPRNPSSSPSRRTFTMLDDLAPDVEIGPEDSRFRLIRKIGGGGMGRVWLARDLSEEKIEGGERYKALKVVSPLLQDSPRALESLKREAVRASRLSHPGIINVYSHRQGGDGWLFVVMDHLDGRDLDQLLEEEGPRGLGWEKTLALVKPMAEALEYAHREHRLIHRDLKPGNVFITQQGEVKLLDFGLAYRLRRSSSIVNVEETHNRGTPQYMPPEAHIGGEPEDVAQDIYALSCMIYEMLTGSPPYSHEAAIQRSPDLFPARPTELSPEAWEVLRSGLAYRKEDRPRSVRELVNRLEDAQRRYGDGSDRWNTRRLWVGLAALVIALGAGAFYLRSVSPDWWQELRCRWLGGGDCTPLEASVFRDLLSSGMQGPEMVQIPVGEFVMGSPPDEPERGDDEHLHRVEMAEPFALSKYEITFELYDRFAAATGRPYPDDNNWGRGRRPVINVNWLDAVAFTEWLSEQTGQNYRLPTEAEWEYAARAGTDTAFAFGDTITTAQANFNGFQTSEKDDPNAFRRRTVAVDLLAANAWGLQQMHGNVWEWTCSAYDPEYQGGEQVCAEGEVGMRVLRGGSWTNISRALRSAYRFRVPPDEERYFLGFRVRRELKETR